VAYIFLFLSAFGAATLLPLQSESVLAGMLILGEYSPVLLIGVATLGNVLG
jgi:membrane protein YqaA with SNARE-associated domain